MSYSDFTLPLLIERFGFDLEEQQDLFAPTTEIAISEFLKTLLDEYVPLALAINTEKARSELMIAPVLVELRKWMNHSISLFSGVDFTVDAAQGLDGTCDFLICRSKEQLFIRAPAIIAIEAKNENIKAGIAQCAATLMAAQYFNEKNNQVIMPLYGIVSTGNIWKFLQLQNNTLAIDCREYYIDRVGVVLGILERMVNKTS